MHIRISLFAALLMLCVSVSADFRTRQLAHEIPLSEFVAPVTQNGILSYRACAECDAMSSRLTVATRYVINNQDVDLPEFRSRLVGLDERETRILTVLQHLETNTVTLVSIRL